MHKIECRCGNTLAQAAAGQLIVTKAGREVIGFITSIRCERCGRVWAAHAEPEPATAAEASHADQG